MSAQELPGLQGVTVERGVECTLPDGVVLRADVYRPAGDGRHPVLLLRLPYDRTVAESDVGFAHPSWFARQGYLVVVQDCRGRHGSDGEWYPFRSEAEDGYATVEWAARLPGANGRVGMYGFSYPGALQLQAAALRPPSLVTICPGFTTPQFHEGWTYDGGAFALAFAASWATFLALDEARRRGDEEALSRLGAALASVADAYWTLPLRDFGPLAEGPDGRYFFDWLEHESYDDYWRSLAVEEDLEPCRPARAARRRLVRRLRGRDGQELRRALPPPRRPATARRRAVVPHAVGSARRRAGVGGAERRGRRRRRVVRSLPEGRRGGGPRGAGHGLRALRRLARLRRVAARGRAPDRLVPALGRPREHRLRRRDALGRRAR